MKNIILLTALLVVSLGLNTRANASVVAVVDSGTDFDHDLLKGHIWVNPKEIPGNRVDDDKNGKVDDVNGWNFAEGYNKLFYPEHLSQIDPIVYRIFEILAHKQAGTLTADDKAFYEKNVTSLTPDQKDVLFAHLEYYGGYAHSTHCSGIVAMRNKNSVIMSARIFPDSEPDAYQAPIPNFPLPGGINGVVYWAAATALDKMWGSVAPYLKENKVRVANYSVGVELTAMVKLILAKQGNKKPTPEQIEVEVKKAYKAFEPSGKKWLAAAPDTLFVIAAGNDGVDTDRLPGYPGSIQAVNKITVAASLGINSLAEFSNFGSTTVDVAAPGVAIMSSVPGPTSDMMLPLSGTSMAAPYVTGVASAMVDANPALKPADIKMILMGTVDKKVWLTGKVISAGVVNQQRAVVAAEKAKTMALADAIAGAGIEVHDQTDDGGLTSGRNLVETPPSLDTFARRLVF